MAVDPNIKIVVADDSGTMRIMFKQILNKAGFKNLVMAVNGADGIEKVKQENLILSSVTGTCPRWTAWNSLKPSGKQMNSGNCPLSWQLPSLTRPSRLPS